MSELFDVELHDDVVRFRQMVKSDIEDNEVEIIEIDTIRELIELPEPTIEALCEYPSVTSKKEIDDTELAEDIRNGKTKFKQDHGINPYRYQVHVRTMPDINKVGDLYIEQDLNGPDALNRRRTGVIINVGPEVQNRKVGEEVIYPEKFGVKYPGIENPYGEIPGMDCEVREIDVHHRITNIDGKWIPGDFQIPSVQSVQMKGESSPKDRRVIDQTAMYGGMYQVVLNETVTYEDNMGREQQTDKAWVQRRRFNL
jgi:hypothetical protein